MFIVHASVSASEPIYMSSVSTYNMQVVRLHVSGAAIRLPPAMMGVGGRWGGRGLAPSWCGQILHGQHFVGLAG